MPHEFSVASFTARTNEPLSPSQRTTLTSAVINGRSLVRRAQTMTTEAQALLMRPGYEARDLPFSDHFRTLFRCTTDAQVRNTLPLVTTAISVLYRGMSSGELTFIEWGMDWVADAINSVGSAFGKALYGPGDMAMVRGFSLRGAHIGQDTFQACLNTGRVSGNPNHVMIKIATIDRGLASLTDTVVHECTHKFLGTEDDGMVAASFGWMADGGLLRYRTENPGMPLPIDTPGFLGKNTADCLRNAYLLTAYIIYLPQIADLEASTRMRYEARAGHLGSETDLGQALRAGLPRRPPDED